MTNLSRKLPRILITSGEPAGIGPDIVVQMAQKNWSAELIVIGDPELLLARAERLKLPLRLTVFDETSLSSQTCRPAACPRDPVGTPGSREQAAGRRVWDDHGDNKTLKIIPIALDAACEPGKLNQANAAYVIRMLETAARYALLGQVDAVVTAPVHKAILIDAGFNFHGHTEFFAEQAGVSTPVMLFVTQNARVALATTHLALVDVSQSITQELLEKVLRTLHQSLITQFGIANPRIFVCGLNPHAGEGGHLGREEIDVITPAIERLRHEQKEIVGPLAADTMFTEKYLKQADAILAMYHDQALPVVKYMGFGNAVNVTLGLPFVRTSVDHGTALDVAGTLQADPGSLKAAIELAIKLTASP